MGVKLALARRWSALALARRLNEKPGLCVINGDELCRQRRERERNRGMGVRANPSATNFHASGFANSISRFYRSESAKVRLSTNVSNLLKTGGLRGENLIYNRRYSTGRTL